MAEDRSIPENAKASLQAAIQELQLWMPNGAQGNGNLPTLLEYMNSPIRQDGALPGSLADYKSYNKVLSQLTKVMVGLAQYVSAMGQAIFDESTPNDIQRAFENAVGSTVIQSLDASQNNIIKKVTGYTQQETIIYADIGPDFPVQVLHHDVSDNEIGVLIFVNGVLYRRGYNHEPIGTKCWYDVASPGQSSTQVRFKVSLPVGTSVISIRYGEVRYAINENR